MNTDEYTKIRHKKLNFDIENSSENKKIKYLKNLVSRILLSIIFVISVSIFIKLDDKNILLVDEYIFKDSLEFTKINNWYQDNVGKIIPELSENTTLVFSSDDLQKNSYTNYLDGVKIDINKNSPISLLMGGIVVFIGEKEGYGYTLILQGNDGIDYWYGGITNLNVNLYDYLEKDTLIGETQNDFLYVVLQKEGKYISYEEILK